MTFVLTKMANPQVEDGYTRVCNELLEALCRARLTEREFRIVLAIIRLTYGFQRKEDKISVRQVAKITGIRPGHVQQAIKRLFKSKVINMRREGQRLVLGLQKDWEAWVLPTGVTVSRKAKNIKGPQATIPHGGNVTHGGNKSVPHGGNIQRKKKLSKKTSREDDPKRGYGDVSLRREVIAEWERTFAASFPEPASLEQIIAADFMLWLSETGKLSALKSPVGYLKKLASSQLESFPSLAERRAKAQAAEERMRIIAEREAKKVLIRLQLDEQAEEEAKRRWEKMSHQERMELLKTIKIRWPNRPTKFWETQAIVAIKKQILKEELCRLSMPH